MAWEIVEGDCQRIITTLPSRHYQMVHLDPPYFLRHKADYLRSYRRTQSKGHIYAGGLDWEFLTRELYRVLDRNAVVGIWGQYPWLMTQTKFFVNAGFKHFSEIIWAKTSPNLVVNWTRPLPSHEDFWILVKGKPITKLHRTSSHTIVRRPNPWTTSGDPAPSSGVGFGKGKKSAPKITGSGYLRSVIFSQSIHGGHPEYMGHPTQKSLDVTKQLLRFCTAPGDRVLDPMAGSGTTILAAEMLGRDSLGIEMNPDYCRMARERLEAWNDTD